MGGDLTELKFDLRTFGFDTMLNHHLSKKLKLIERDKFNHLINTLIPVEKTKVIVNNLARLTKVSF